MNQMSNKWYEKSGPEGDVVVSTRIRLARNLSNYPFPCRMAKEQRYELANLVNETLVNSNSYIADTFDFIDMSKISDNQTASLVERHIISPNFAVDREGKFLLLTKDESISIMINEEDHLRIQVMSEGLDLKRAYDKADKIDTLFDEKLHFAFDPKLGYLTQCPTNLGTGLRASVMLHMPALQASKAMGRLEGNLSKIGLALRGTFGEGSEAKAALYQLSNQVSLGLSENTAVDNLASVAMQLVTQERTSRKALLNNIETIDYIHRSLGTLKWAVLLNHAECMQLLSAVRLGVAENKLDGISLNTINSLLINIQPATLVEKEKRKLSPQERDHERAKLVQETLGKITA